MKHGEITERKEGLKWPAGTDPVSQAALWIPERLYPWQVNVLRDLVTEPARVAMVTPNESGKTSVVIPVAGLSFMAAFPGSMVVSTSGVERQIKNQLWPVLRACLAKYPKWTITEDLTVKAPGIRGLPASTWEAFTTKDPEYAEGFHSRLYRDDKGKITYCPLMVIVDEAKTFSDNKMFDAFRRCDPDIWLVVSTPGEDVGPFFNCFHVNRGRPWRCHEITWTDCPHLRVGRKLQERLELIRERGEEDPFVLSFVFGKFFRAGGRLIFDKIEDVEHAMSGLVKRTRGTRKVALDFSGGGDEQVFACREGNCVLALETFRMKDTAKLTDEFIRLFRKWEVTAEDITADNGGLGKPIIDNMEAKGWRGIRRYMADATPRDDRFVNRSAEDHFTLRQRLSERSISLLRDEGLEDQMRRRRFFMRNDDSNRIRVEPKEKMRDRGEGSPDRLDTIVMLFADMPPPPRPEEQKRGGLRTGFVEDVMKTMASGGEESGWASSRFED